MGVGPGDAVLCPSFTFCATGDVGGAGRRDAGFRRCRRGDLQHRYQRHRSSAASRPRGSAASKPRAVIPVDLFGQTADHGAIAAIAKAEGLLVLDDAAQGFGASYKGRTFGTFGQATATSFFPAKPLGCYGDGGAMFTDDDELAETLRSIRVHGQGTDKYDNVRLGLTGRLDTMQAAMLIEKLKIFDDEIEARNRVAERYARGLGNVVTVPRLAAGYTSVWAQYTIRLLAGTRPRCFAAALKARGRADRDLLPKVDASADRLQALSGRRRRPAGQRAARRTTSSACRCTPIWTSRRRSASSRRCAARCPP